MKLTMKQQRRLKSNLRCMLPWRRVGSYTRQGNLVMILTLFSGTCKVTCKAHSQGLLYFQDGGAGIETPEQGC